MPPNAELAIATGNDDLANRAKHPARVCLIAREANVALKSIHKVRIESQDLVAIEAAHGSHQLRCWRQPFKPGHHIGEAIAGL